MTLFLVPLPLFGRKHGDGICDPFVMWDLPPADKEWGIIWPPPVWPLLRPDMDAAEDKVLYPPGEVKLNLCCMGLLLPIE